MAYRSLIKKNFNLKVVVFSVLLATTFWFLRAMDKPYTTNITVSFKVLSDSTFVRVGTTPKKIKLNVTGYGWTIFKKSIGIGTSVLTFNLSDASNPTSIQGSEVFPYIADKVDGLKVNFVKTEQVDLNYDFKKAKTITIQLEGVGATQDYESNPRIINDQINVSGARKMIKDIPTNLIVQLNEARTVNDTCAAFHLYDYLPSEVVLSDSIVQVFFRLKRWESKTQNVALTYDNFPKRIRKNLKDQSVQLTYESVTSKNENDVGFILRADYKNLKNDTIPIQCIPNNNAEIRKIDYTPQFIVLQ